MSLSAVVTWKEGVKNVCDGMVQIGSMFESLRAFQEDPNKDGVGKPSVTFKVGYLDSQEALESFVEGISSISNTGMIRSFKFDGSIMASNVNRQALDLLFNLVASIQSLEELEWTEGSLEPLAKMLRYARNISSITYRDDHLGINHGEVLQFADALSGHPALKTVSFLGTRRNDPLNINPVFNALSTLPLLQHVFLVSDNIDARLSGPSPFLGLCDKPSLTTLAVSLHTQGFASFYDGLLTCGNVTELVLMTPIKAEHCRFLSEIVRCNRVLQHLCIGITSVEDEQHVHAVAEALGSNTTMENISFMCGNDKDMLGAEVQDSFVSMMRHRNFTLTGITFANALKPGGENGKSPYHEIKYKLDFYSKLNKNGRKALMADLGGGTKDLLAYFLISNRDMIDVTFYYLSMAPELIYG